MPKFRLILKAENNLVGPADDRPHISTAGGNQGTYVRYSETVTPDDPRLVKNGGTITHPPVLLVPYNVDWLTSHLACVLEGDAEWKFAPADLKDFFEVQVSEPDGKIVTSYLLPAVFNAETFIGQKWLQMFNSQRELAIQVNNFGWEDGQERTKRETYQLRYRVNPKYGECEWITVVMEFNGHDLKILPSLPQLLTWKPVGNENAPKFPWNEI